MRAVHIADDDNLRLEALLEDHGLSGGWALVMAEAAATCLDTQGHANEVGLSVTGQYRRLFLLCRPSADDLTRRNHRDEKKAVEVGACGIAILLIRRLTGCSVIEQAVQMDGIDYWIGEVEEGRPMNRKARLEVTGTLDGGEKEVRSRVRQKTETTRKSDGSLPVYIVVVEFGNPMAKVVMR